VSAKFGSSGARLRARLANFSRLIQMAAVRPCAISSWWTRTRLYAG
jgi:hypothetical protein